MSDRTLARIAALLRKAEGTDNDHEADAYLQAAQRLASAAAIDLAVARAHGADGGRPVRPIQREVHIGEAGKRGLRTYVELYLAIAGPNDVRCDVARNSTRVFAYGFATDVDTVDALYRSLLVQMVRASDEFIRSGAYTVERVRRYSRARRRWSTGPVSAITARLSFQRAFAARIARRLDEARDQAVRSARGTHTASGVELAVRAKEVQVADHYRQHSTARGRWQGSAVSAGYSEHASRAGDRAGRRARIGASREIGPNRRAVDRDRR